MTAWIDRAKAVAVARCALGMVLSACGGGGPGGGGSAPTATPALRATATPTSTDPATVTPTTAAVPTGTPTPTATATPTGNDGLSIAEAVARDANGVAVHLGETVTTGGVVTVSAGIFANNKLKIFIQEGARGIMAYHQTSSAVDAYQAGQCLQATGVIRQQDPTSDNNLAIGTVLVDVTAGSIAAVAECDPVPAPAVVTLAALHANGADYTGTLVRVAGVRKVSGAWPAVGSKSTQVTVSDDGGLTTSLLRLQRATITEALVHTLDAIGAGAFTLTGIVVQDDATDDGKLLSGFEIWVRGAEDIAAD